VEGENRNRSILKTGTERQERGSPVFKECISAPRRLVIHVPKNFKKGEGNSSETGSFRAVTGENAGGRKGKEKREGSSEKKHPSKKSM